MQTSPAEKNESINQERKPKKLFRWILLALLLIGLGPYLYTRLRAPNNRLQTFDRSASSDNTNSERTFNNELSIVSFNIAHGRGTASSNWTESAKPKRERIAAIAAALQAIDADIVVLNEVDFNSTWSGGQNQAAAIAKAAGYRYHVQQRNLDFGFIYGSWQFGNAILSHYPITDAQMIDFPPEKAWEDWLVGCKRGAIASVQLAPNKTIRVGAIHLEHRSETVRAAGAELLTKLGQNKTAGRLILAGDFNSTPAGFPHSRQPGSTSNALDLILASKAFHCYPESNPRPDDYTFSTMQPKSVIDWIMVARQTNQAQQTPFTKYSVIDTTLSDHRLLHAVIELD